MSATNPGQKVEEQPTEKLLVKISKAAAMLDLCDRTIKRLIDQGKLQSVKCGRSRLVVVASIHAYVFSLLQK